MADNKTTTPPDRGRQTIRGRGRRRRHGRRGAEGVSTPGPAGSCVCPNCRNTTPHVAGKPCNQQTCPECGARMIRE